MGLVPNIQGILARLYTDRMDVRRYVEAEDADGNAETVLDAVPELTGIPCKISFQGMDSPVTTSDGNPAEIQPTLICAPGIPLHSGDFVTITRRGTIIYSGRIGRPNPYQNSLQALFLDKVVS